MKNSFIAVLLTGVIFFSCQDNVNLGEGSTREREPLRVETTTITEALKLRNASLITPNSGMFTLFKGSNNFSPEGAAVDKDMNLYIADRLHHCIYRINGYTGQMKIIVGVSGLAGYKDGAGDDVNVKLNSPSDVAVDQDGNTLYISDTGNHRIRKYDIKNDVVYTIVGSGIGGGYGEGAGTYTAKLNSPKGIALTKDGKYLYIADRNNYRIRLYDILNDMLSTAVGTGVNGFADGQAKNAKVGPLVDLEVAYHDGAGNDVFFSEGPSDFGKIRIYSPSTQEVISTQQSRSIAYFNGGLGLNQSAPPEIYTTYYLHRFDFCGIASFSFWGTPTWSQIPGTTGYRDGALSNALFENPTDITVSNGGILLISDTYNNAIRFMFP